MLLDSHYDEKTVATDMRIEVKTLRGRISRGTDHPPFIKIGREYWFPKKMYLDWIGKQFIIHEVRSSRAS